jgi:hypothetical protein
VLAEQSAQKLLRISASEAWIELLLGDNDEFLIYFDSANGDVAPELLETARSFMRTTGKLDNQVQDSCAAECRRTGLHPRNYESMLAYVRIFQDSALLGYFGAEVNTDWDESAKFQDGEWVYVGIAR